MTNDEKPNTPTYSFHVTVGQDWGEVHLEEEKHASELKARQKVITLFGYAGTSLLLLLIIYAMCIGDSEAIRGYSILVCSTLTGIAGWACGTTK